MRTTTTHFLTPQTNASTRDRERTLQVGTFADGQRGVPVTVTYSAEVGSFGRAGRE
jgi:hypothetical protein